jgi:hypothetical protein
VKVIIAGSRNIHDYNLIKKIIYNSGFNITEIISGAAIGVDILGIRYALENSISFKIFKVTKKDWRMKGRSAGIIRNRNMGDYADALIAIWDGKSSGTKDMINYARLKNLQYFVRIIN